MAYKTRGVVIRRVAFGDNDLILTLFTERAGKLSVFSNGARNPKNQKAAASQLFVHADLEIFLGKKSNTLYNADVIYSHYALREDFEKLAYASYLLELVDFTHKEGQVSPEVYQLLVEVLAALEKERDGGYEKCKCAFEMKLLGSLGLSPRLDRCLGCQGPATSKVTFDLTEGGFFCNQCKKSGGLSVPDTLLRLLRYYEKKSFGEVSEAKVHPFYLERATLLMDGYLKTHLGYKEFRSLDILNAFRKAGEKT